MPLLEVASGLPDINEVFQQIDQWCETNQIAQVDKAIELLDRLCISDYKLLRQMSVEHIVRNAGSGDQVFLREKQKNLKHGTLFYAQQRKNIQIAVGFIICVLWSTMMRHVWKDVKRLARWLLLLLKPLHQLNTLKSLLIIV